MTGRDIPTCNVSYATCCIKALDREEDYWLKRLFRMCHIDCSQIGDLIGVDEQFCDRESCSPGKVYSKPRKAPRLRLFRFESLYDIFD